MDGVTVSGTEDQRENKNAAKKRDIRLIVPLVCLLAATGAFWGVYQASPIHAPLVMGIVLVAMACVYDFTDLSVPKWVIGAIAGSGIAYNAALWLGWLPIPAELAAVMPPGSFDFLIYWGVGIMATFVVGGMLFSLANTGGQDVHLLVALAVLLPLRTVPNVNASIGGFHGGVLFASSIALNAVVVGAVVAFAIGIVRRAKFGKTRYDDRVPPPESYGQASRNILWVLGILAFWTVIGRLAAFFDANSFLMVFVWMFVAFLGMYTSNFIPTLPWAVNWGFIAFYLPTILPIPAAYGATYIVAMIMAFGVVAIVHTGLDVMARTCYAGGKCVYPFVPAILVALVITATWGDFVMGWIYPIASQWWFFI